MDIENTADRDPVVHLLGLFSEDRSGYLAVAELKALKDRALVDAGQAQRFADQEHVMDRDYWRRRVGDKNRLAARAQLLIDRITAAAAGEDG